MTPEERARLEYLEGIVSRFMLEDRYYSQKDFQLADGRNLILGGNSGTKIGASTSKIGVFGATPVARANAIGAPSTTTISGSGADSAINTNFTNIVSTQTSIRTALKNFGLTA